VNQSLPALINGLLRSLREVVLPELQSDHARGQLAGVLDVLGKFERLLVWSPDLLRSQLQTVQTGCSAIVAAAAATGVVVPTAISSESTTEPNSKPTTEPNSKPTTEPNSPPLLQADLERALSAAEQQLIALTDWLFEPSNALTTDTRVELDHLMRETLRTTLVSERRLITRADFTAMNSPGST
jgi:hypothetical protein